MVKLTGDLDLEAAREPLVEDTGELEEGESTRLK